MELRGPLYLSWLLDPLPQSTVPDEVWAKGVDPTCYPE